MAKSMPDCAYYVGADFVERVVASAQAGHAWQKVEQRVRVLEAAAGRRWYGFDLRIGELGRCPPHVEVMGDQDPPPNPGRAQDFGATQRIFVGRARARLKPLHRLPEF